MRITNFLAVLALLAFTATAFSQTLPSADKLMSGAKAKAAKEKKAVWVVFHASW